MTVESKSIGAGGMPLSQKRESLWQDGLRRLTRNRAAVVGASIIILLILMAVLAPLIAVKPFEKQVLVDQNRVPKWLVSIFPSVEPYAKYSSEYPLGADYVGRDLFSRIVYGARFAGGRFHRSADQLDHWRYLWQYLRLFWRPRG